MTTTRKPTTVESELRRKLKRAETEAERWHAEADRARSAARASADALQGERLVQSDPRIGNAFLNVMRAATNSADEGPRAAVAELLILIGGVNDKLAETLQESFARPLVEIPRSALDVLLESLGAGATPEKRDRAPVARSYMNGWIVSVHKVMGEAGYMAPGLPPSDHVALQHGSLAGLAAARKAIDVAESGDMPQKEGGA